MPAYKLKGRYDEPVMSDLTILVSVEDLINIAMGPADGNSVNFKMIQTVLLILARQLRLLEQSVELKIADLAEMKRKKKKETKEQSSDTAPSDAPRKRGGPLEEIEEEKSEDAKKSKKSPRDKGKKDKSSKGGEKEDFSHKKGEQSSAKDSYAKSKHSSAEDSDDEIAEQEKLAKMSPEEKEKYLKEKHERQKKRKKQVSDDKDDISEQNAEEQIEKSAKKVKDLEKKLLEKMSPAEREIYKKQKEMEEKLMKNMSPIERAKYLKKKEKELSDMMQMTPKDIEKQLKEKEKELNALQDMSPAEREKYFRKMISTEKEMKKDKEKAGQKSTRDKSQEQEEDEPKSSRDKEKYQERETGESMSPKDKNKYQEKDQKLSKHRDISDQEEEKGETKSLKEKEKEIKRLQEAIEEKMLEKMSPKEKELYMKQKESEEKAFEKMSPKEKEMYMKQKERDEKAFQKMSPIERELYLKQKESENKALQKMTPKEKELYFKQKASGDKAFEKLSPKEKELYLKQKDRENETLQSMSPKEREVYLRQIEKENKALEKMSPKEREKYFAEKEKELQELEKMSPKEREKYFKEKEQQLPKATGSGTSISITEVEREKEKVLVVEKGPTTRRGSQTRVGSIDVVTQSQFNLLGAEVEKLKKVAGPLPMPALPDDKKLRADLVKGSASLTDTMQAMQVSARVKAAEAGLARMAGLLTQLAASGALPESIVGQLEEAKANMEMLKAGVGGETGRKSVGIDSFAPRRTDDGRGASSYSGTRPSSASGMDRPRASIAVSTGRPSRVSTAVGSSHPMGVTRKEMDSAIQALADDMLKQMQAMTYRAASSAETAAGTAKGIADKMEYAMKINSRISDLHGLTSDYAEQLSGFGAGLTMQMQSFQEQMAQMRSDLQSGMVVLESANNNAETAAVKELTERYNDLQHELDASLVLHAHLTNYQKQLGEDLQGLIEAIETLKEQKADREEVWDGLRDKADMSKLEGLLSLEEFGLAKGELMRRLDMCYDKFNKQDATWTTALKELGATTLEKAEIMQLLSIKEDAQDQLNDMQEKLRLMTIHLGEPTAAILTRLLSKDGKCGACRLPALMEATDKTAGKPFPMPALRPPPDGQEPCGSPFPPLPPVLDDGDTKAHICKRWVGGSHTLLPRSERHEMAPTQIAPAQPVKRYTGYGVDGKPYNLEVELEPCVECNKLTPDDGAGDGVCDCYPDG